MVPTGAGANGETEGRPSSGRLNLTVLVRDRDLDFALFSLLLVSPFNNCEYFILSYPG